jgi:hypothetical protein
MTLDQLMSRRRSRSRIELSLLCALPAVVAAQGNACDGKQDQQADDGGHSRAGQCQQNSVS